MQKPKRVKINVQQIKIDNDLNVRENIDPDTVTQYTDIIETMPPISCINSGDGVYLIDGFHRFEAIKQRSFTECDCMMYEGGWDTAIELAISLNCSHGRPFSPRERKTAAVRIIALHPDWTDNKIADCCGCSHNSVTKWRQEKQENPIPKPEKLSNDDKPQAELQETKHLMRHLRFKTEEDAQEWDRAIDIARRVSGSDSKSQCALHLAQEFIGTYEAA